jgi:hypothetical protein
MKKKKPLSFILKRQKSRIKNPIKKRARLLRKRAKAIGFEAFHNSEMNGLLKPYISQGTIEFIASYEYYICDFTRERSKCIMSVGPLEHVEEFVNRYWNMKAFL